MGSTGKPVCNVSTFAIASARFDLNLFRLKLLGLWMVMGRVSAPPPSPSAFIVGAASASFALASSAIRAASALQESRAALELTPSAVAVWDSVVLSLLVMGFLRHDSLVSGM